MYDHLLSRRMQEFLYVKLWRAKLCRMSARALEDVFLSSDNWGSFYQSVTILLRTLNSPQKCFFFFF